jgi:two-component system, NarL family, response regulator NreC
MIRILLVDDHKIVRTGLRSLIDGQSGMMVVAEADDGRAAMQLIKELRPEVVIMDVAMPDLNGMEATRQIVADFPEVKVVALSMHSDRRFVTGMLEAGASGYLLKDCAFEELTSAIRAVVRKQAYISPGVAGVLVEDVRRRATEAAQKAPVALTAREREVIQLLAEGHSTKDIAHTLGVSVKTVESYRQRVMEKLGIHSVAELTKWAVREGLSSLEC